MAGQQRTLDFARGEQLALLRDAEIPRTIAPDGRPVSTAALKAVLRAIDDFGRGRPSFASTKTIAQAAGLGERTVKRAISALSSAELDLLCVERRSTGAGRTTSNYYRIVWSQLALLAGRSTSATSRRRAPREIKPATSAASRRRGCGKAVSSQSGRSPPDQSATGTDQSATGTDQSATVAPPEAPLSAFEAPPPLPPLRTSRGVGDDSFLSEDQIASELSKVGLKYPRRFAREAAQRRLTAAQLAEAIETYRANRERFDGPGALIWWLRTGQWPAEEVREAAAIRAARQKREAELERRRREDRRQLAEHRQGRIEQDALEAAYGAELDAMPLDELLRFGGIVFADHPFLLERLRRRPRSAAIRYQLLCAIHEDQS